MWNCSTGARLLVGGCANTFGTGIVTASYASDAIALTNDIAVVIGQGTVFPNRTYVDILDISTGGTPSCLANHVIDPTNAVGVRAGLVSDVAITPDGAYAIVNHRNWIHVFDLTANGAIAAAFNIGGPAGGTNECFPGPQSDSIAVSNTHAVVLTTREVQVGAMTVPRTWVYVVSLLVDPPILGLGADLTASTLSEQGPHDVAITPDGNLAFVAADQMVALIKLGTTSSVVGSSVDQPFHRRRYAPPGVPFGAIPVDSVEVTNDRAVVLSEEIFPPWNTRTWIVEVWGISTTALTSFPEVKGSLIPGVQPTDVPHDLAVFQDGSVAKAVIKTAGTEIVIGDLSTAGGWFFHPMNAKPYHDPGLVLVSDSVSLFRPYSAGRWALMIGTWPDTSNRWRGYLTAINLNGPPYTIATLTMEDNNHDTVPSDLVSAHLGLDGMVRCYAPPDETNPALGGRDFARLLMTPGVGPPTEHVRYGGKGEAILALDNLAVGRDAVVSISEVAVPVQGQTNGYVHFVRATFQ